MRYIIDTDTMTITEYKEPEPEQEPAKKTPISILSAHLGEREYTGFVETIQRWYYGRLVKASWCATCASYILHLLGAGIPKAENVYWLMVYCANTAKSGRGTFYGAGGKLPDKLRPNDVCFWLRSAPPMTTGSKKHVNFCVSDDGDTVRCIGGNQDDCICIKDYNKRFLYAVYRMEG